MSITRRGLVARAAGAPVTLAGLGAACAPRGGLPGLSLAPKVVHAAAFVSQESNVSFGGKRAPVELQRAANAVNEQRPGCEVHVHLLPLPPQPPRPAATEPGPTPTPFWPTAAALDQVLQGGDATGGAAGAPPPDLVLLAQMNELLVPLERQLIQPTEEVTKAERSFKLDDLAPGALETVRFRGKLAALPLMASVYTLWHDAALFDTAGAARPDGTWTWQAPVEAGRRAPAPRPAAALGRGR